MISTEMNTLPFCLHSHSKSAQHNSKDMLNENSDSIQFLQTSLLSKNKQSVRSHVKVIYKTNTLPNKEQKN